MPFPILPVLGAIGGAALNFLGGQTGAGMQQRRNMELAKYQYQMDMRMMRYMNRYNTPANQMKRFEAAGLNPNLVYGQGSSGNMESMPRHPQIEPANFQESFMQLGTQFQQMLLMKAQTDLTQNKADESGVKQDLMKAQQDLIKANPLMNESYVSALVRNLEYTARVKESQSIKENFLAKGFRTKDGGYSIYEAKVLRELDLLDQRFKLSESDQAIKAKIIESKEFENALKEIQVNWQKDANITPQHIYQGIMLLLSKMM